MRARARLPLLSTAARAVQARRAPFVWAPGVRLMSTAAARGGAAAAASASPARAPSPSPPPSSSSSSSAAAFASEALTPRVRDLLWRADAVCFDVDSTVVTVEGIDELAAAAGKGAEVAALTNA